MERPHVLIAPFDPFLGLYSIERYIQGSQKPGKSGKVMESQENETSEIYKIYVHACSPTKMMGKNQL